MMSIDDLIRRQTDDWRSKQPQIVEHIANQHAIVNSDDLLSLICNEVRLREESGETPPLTEYQRRFPNLVAELELQWKVDAMLDTTLGPPDAAPVSEHPEFIGRYEVLREIGRGTSGVVYEAFDSNLNRSVAVKCLRAENHLDYALTQRFQLEAETIGKLNHPNIAQVFDSGRDKSVSYIVMEYCEYGTLADIVGEPLATEVAVSIGLQLASAVAAAHTMGIIHRDLKPANVLLSRRRNTDLVCKVTDFGLAKWMGSESDATVTGAIVGSPAYMAPEQALGNASEVTYQADIYSIGAILYQLLTGRPPLLGSSIAETIHQIKYVDPLEVRQLNLQVSKDLETIVSKCLSKSPESRLGSSQLLFDELTRVSDGKPIRSKPEWWHQKIVRIGKRHPQTAKLVAVTIALLAIITMGSAWFSIRLNDSLQQARAAERVARLEKAEALLGQAAGHRLGGLSGRRIVAQSILNDAMAIGKQLKQPNTWFDRFRDEAIETMWFSDLAVANWRRWEKPPIIGSFSPNQELFATLSSEGRLEIREWSSDHIVASEPIESPTYLAWADDHGVLVSGTHQIRSLEIVGSSLKQVWARSIADVSHLTFIPRNNLVACYSKRGVLFLDRDLGNIKYELKTNAQDTFIAACPHRPIYLVASYFEPQLELRSLDDHSLIWKEELEHGLSSVAWSPNGRQFLVFPGDGQDPKLYDLPLGSVHPQFVRLIPFGIGGGALAIWSTGDQILSLNWNSQIRLTDMHSKQKLILPYAGPYFTYDFGSYRDSSSRFCIVSNTIQNAKYFGPLEFKSGNEQHVLEVNAASASPSVMQRVFHRSGLFVLPELKFVDMLNGRIVDQLQLNGLPLGSTAVDAMGQMHLVGIDYSALFDMSIQGSEIMVSKARRSMIQPGFPEITLSQDGNSQVLGYWNGYSDTPYAGAWIKSPSEPIARKVFGFESGKYSAISPDAQQAIVYFENQAFITKFSTDKPKLLTTHSLLLPIAFDASGKYAIAGGRLWDTQKWSPLELSSHELNGSQPYLFCRDGGHAVFRSKTGKSQFVDLSTGQVYLSLEGNVLQYLSKSGRLLMQLPNESCVYRNLMMATNQLKQLGLDWNGPKFDDSSLVKLESVRLSSELQKLQSWTQWLDYLDEQTIQEAIASPDDGHAQFRAAYVCIEQYRLRKSLELLERSMVLLPDALTPHQWRSYVLAALGRFPEAIDEATYFIDRTGDPAMRILRAAWFLETNQPHLAILDTEAAVRENVILDRRAKAMLILSYREMGDRVSELSLRRLYEQDRATSRQLSHAALPLVSHDITIRNTRLASLYSEFFLESRDLDVAHSLPWIKLREGQYEEALALSKQILDQNHNLVERCYATILMSMSNAKLGRFDLARTQLQLCQQAYNTEEQSQWSSHLRPLRMLMFEASQAIDPRD